MSRISLPEFSAILDRELPMTRLLGIETESIAYGSGRLRMRYNPDLVRPGGTVAGPAMMALADIAMYAVVLSLLGPVELAVTTNLSINFLRKPAPGDIVAEAHTLKGGKRLIVVEVELFSEDADSPDGRALVAHTVGTYSAPPLPDRSAVERAIQAGDWSAVS
ncbi:PaaI family thioesterase [Roseospira navarrensis]|uniref:Hotdog fold thioesterase n=1 Tax=Roseospira navarrensis TaxID=140058 RepID=A0A7X1ZE99_9PROT|nr:PaaI family thioesterase [Roseospira navarrensis]MQX36965.1 hotdog fold thioesterase [Roseospira navarrensis]